MKITETTTLAELAAYLKALGDPFVTLMKAHPQSGNMHHAIIHVAGVGTFHGGGDTVAQALEDALTSFRYSTLPEPLKQYGKPGTSHIGPTGLDGNKFRQHADELCHGCSHHRDDHPNETGCQSWHDTATTSTSRRTAGLRTRWSAHANGCSSISSAPTSRRSGSTRSASPEPRSEPMCSSCGRNITDSPAGGCRTPKEHG